MKLRVELFGPLRPFASGSGLELELPEGARIGDAREAIAAALAARSPAARAIVARSALATEDEVLSDDDAIPAGARSLAILPPVSGG